jgi:DNA-binding GntR family transcriptional regulator
MPRARATDAGRIRHRTMAEFALEELREAIILGELKPGTPLRLDELARSLGMSISPIREAVRQLEALGLAKHVPHQGARVLPFDVDDLRDLFEVRLVLEALAVRRAAVRITEEEIEVARGHLSRLDAARTAGDVLAAMRAHTDFHFSLYDACGAPWLPQMIRPAWDRSERFRPALFSAAGELQDKHREMDGRLLDACAAHDPELASTTLYEHLDLAGRFYAPELGERGLFDR